MTDFTVTIGGKRGDEWNRICGTRTFPVRSPIHSLADLPNKLGARVYFLDLDSLEPELFAKIVSHLAQKFGLPPEETEREIREHGIPILDEECSVTIRNPQRWFS